MMDMRSFRASPAAVASAGVRERADAGEQPRYAEVVELLVSELASNAVTHAATPFTISVQRRTKSRLGSRCPTPVTRNRAFGLRILLAVNGRGLQLLGALADSWGVEPSETGKTVWFLLGTRPDS